jgi:hypothetical protein
MSNRKNKSNLFSLLDSDSEEDNKNINNNVVIKKDDIKQTGISINDIEENMFKQYYGKREIKVNKSIKNSNYETNDFIQVNKKKDKIISECTFIPLESNILDLTMSNYYRLLAHHNDDKNWDYLSYHNITTLSKWGDLPKLFNTLNTVSGETSYTDFDIFLMKNDISPMWEDPENRNGSICSIKIDSLSDAYEIFKLLAYHMVNNTLVTFSPNMWDIVNGLSYSSKKMDHLNLDSYCVILKIWFKINMLNHGLIEKLLNNYISKIIFCVLNEIPY